MIAGLVLLGGGVAAGVFGSLLGLGGGVLIVPLLNLGFGLPLRQAVAISLVSVIVTSSASAAVYLQRHVANLRLGMTLELFSASGAFAGGLVAFLIDERLLAGLFAALMIWVAISMARRKDAPRAPATDRAAAAPAAAIGLDGPAEAERARLALDPAAPEAVPAGLRADPADTAVLADAPQASMADGSLTTALSGPGYRVHGIPLGMAGSVFAGVNSALLGVGGGIVKVPVMHLLMRVPLRTSTATSNMMMGITAVASAVIYLLRNELDPYVAGPVVLGVFAGATLGSRLAHRVDLRLLRWLFIVVLAYTAFQMIRKALAI